MFQVAPQVVIRAAPSVVGEHLASLECWWLPASPDQLERTAGKQAGEGIRVAICRRGPGTRSGSAAPDDPDRSLAWRSISRTRWSLGLPVSIDRGVSWELRPVEGGTQLSAYVWVRFPRTLPGRIVEWAFVRLAGRRRVYRRAFRELRLIKERAERRVPSGVPV